MEKSDKRFWDLTKQIFGLEQTKNKGTPSVDELVGHIASNLSNATDVYDNEWQPPNHWKGKAKL